MYKYAPIPDFHYMIVNLILAFLGKERCACDTFFRVDKNNQNRTSLLYLDKTFPKLLIGWGRLREKERIFSNIHFECLKTCIHFQKTRRSIYLLEIEQLQRSLCFKFDKLVVCYTPVTRKTGHVTICGEKIFVEIIYSDLVLLYKHFNTNSVNKIYKPGKETESYVLRQLKHALEIE